MNVREKLERIVMWLSYQDENLSLGLRSMEDGIELFNFAVTNEHLPEFVDEWSDADFVLAIGYNPFKEGV